MASSSQPLVCKVKLVVKASPLLGLTEVTPVVGGLFATTVMYEVDDRAEFANDVACNRNTYVRPPTNESALHNNGNEIVDIADVAENVFELGVIVLNDSPYSFWYIDHEADTANVAYI